MDDGGADDRGADDNFVDETKKAHGNPQAFYFILIPKGHQLCCHQSKIVITTCCVIA
jgi:hypothetical protein